MVSVEEITGLEENDFYRHVHKLEKHGRGRFFWSWVRRGWDRLRRTDLHDVVAEKHHLEEEGDGYVEKNNWDDEYPAHARVRLTKWPMRYCPRQRRYLEGVPFGGWGIRLHK